MVETMAAAVCSPVLHMRRLFWLAVTLGCKQLALPSNVCMRAVVSMHNSQGLCYSVVSVITMAASGNGNDMSVYIPWLPQNKHHGSHERECKR